MHDLSLLEYWTISQPYVCNECHDISMMAYDLENIAILNVKVLIFDVLYGI